MSHFWAQQSAWPRDTATHVFLGRAVHLIGAGLFGAEWTGKETVAVPELPLPQQSLAKRGDRLKAHRILAGDASYSVKERPVEWPGSISPFRAGTVQQDYAFTEDEWHSAQLRQSAVVQGLIPSFSRLRSVHDTIMAGAAHGRLRMACRRPGEVRLTPIIADAWPMLSPHAIFESCNLAATASTQAPIFVFGEDLVRLQPEPQSPHSLKPPMRRLASEAQVQADDQVGKQALYKRHEVAMKHRMAEYIKRHGSKTKRDAAVADLRKEFVWISPHMARKRVWQPVAATFPADWKLQTTGPK